MTEQKDTICKSLANILLQFLKIIFALIFLFLSFFFLIKNSPFVLEQKLITVENAEDNPEIFYELKNIETNAVIEFSEEKLTNLLSAFFLPKNISFADKANFSIKKLCFFS